MQWQPAPPALRKIILTRHVIAVVARTTCTAQRNVSDRCPLSHILLPDGTWVTDFEQQDLARIQNPTLPDELTKTLDVLTRHDADCQYALSIGDDPADTFFART